MLAKHKVICFLPESKAQYLQSIYRNDDGSNIISISNMKFSFSKSCYFFKKGSPFVEKINEILQKLIESGLIDQLNKIQDFKYTIKDCSGMNRLESDIVSSKLIIIILFGNILSFIIFLMELMVKNCA